MPSFLGFPPTALGNIRKGNEQQEMKKKLQIMNAVKMVIVSDSRNSWIKQIITHYLSSR